MASERPFSDLEAVHPQHEKPHVSVELPTDTPEMEIKRSWLKRKPFIITVALLLIIGAIIGGAVGGTIGKSKGSNPSVE